MFMLGRKEEKMTVVELREKAKALGIKNVKKYKKDELLRMVEKIEKADEEAVYDTVIMVAFTGMELGEFKIMEETESIVTVSTKKWDLRFDKLTGIQLNPKNERFANKIVVK